MTTQFSSYSKPVKGEADGKYEITNLPTGTVVDISKYLDLLDKINICSAIPAWKWLLSTPRIKGEFQRQISGWTWADEKLCEYAMKSDEPSIEDLCEMVIYQRTQEELFSNRRGILDGRILRCLVLGPAVDRLGIMTGFYETLLSLVDTHEERQIFSNPPGSISNGIPVRIRSATKIPSTDILLDVLTLHARVKSRRAQETSRIRDSFIISDGSLSEKARLMITSTDIVFYFVIAQTDELDWSEIRFELSKISLTLSSNQTLFVIGVCDEEAENCDFFPSIVKIARNLNNVNCNPLNESIARWRIWVLKRKGSNYSNLVEIFQWASYDFTARSASVRQNSNLFSILYDFILSPFKQT